MQEPSSTVVYQDEVWWSRLAQPQLLSWATAQHHLPVEEWSKDKDDPEAAALCCYGALCEGNSKMLLRFVAARAVSETTEHSRRKLPAALDTLREALAPSTPTLGAAPIYCYSVQRAQRFRRSYL